jgi:hypothetical protein
MKNNISHTLLIDAMKKMQLENQNPTCLDLEAETNEVLARKYFLNYRGGNPENTKGYRLTNVGLATFECFFTSYCIELPDNYKSNTKHLLFFDRNCIMPWHLYNCKLTLFEEQMTMHLKMTGDIDTLIKVFHSNKNS